jgi:hypothetical protein
MDTVVTLALVGFDHRLGHALAQGKASRSLPALFQFASLAMRNKSGLNG